MTLDKFDQLEKWKIKQKNYVKRFSIQQEKTLMNENNCNMFFSTNDVQRTIDICFKQLIKATSFRVLS